MKTKNAIIITGSIATGKSTVCKILKQKGFETVSADEISHAILDTKRDEIVDIFGEDFLDKSGKPDRKKIGKVIFACREKKEKLEKLLHVEIFNEIDKIAQKLENKGKIYFLDIPLYFESKNRYNIGFVCVVYAPKEMQLKRLTQRDKIEKELALKKIESQMDIELKRKKADFVIDNSKDKEHLTNEIERFLENLRERYGYC